MGEESNDIVLLETVDGVFQEDVPEMISSIEIPDLDEADEAEKESENIEVEEEGGK